MLSVFLCRLTLLINDIRRTIGNKKEKEASQSTMATEAAKLSVFFTFVEFLLYNGMVIFGCERVVKIVFFKRQHNVPNGTLSIIYQNHSLVKSLLQNDLLLSTNNFSLKIGVMKLCRLETIYFNFMPFFGEESYMQY